MTSFANVYHHRKVADTAPKPCDVCYKPSTSVLVTPDKKDFFYICHVHLKDKSFAIPIIDEAAIAAKSKAKKDAELEKVKQDLIEERKAKEEEKKKKKEKQEDKSTEDKDNQDVKNNEKITDEKISDEIKSPVLEDEPRVFTLHKSFYQQRLDKKRNVERAKRERERLQNPKLFPQVPKGPP